MGKLIDGQWSTTGYKQDEHGGSFERDESVFRDHIEPGGTFAPESGRYHLYVSYACPWAHRTLIIRALKGLTPHISVSFVDWYMGDEGWTFNASDDEDQKIVEDPIHGAQHLRDVYLKAEPDMTGRVTVPLLWDKQSGSVVNNESPDIVRMFNSAFNDVVDAEHAARDYYPAALKEQIDTLNERIYDTVNNGVYRAGFATEQAPYEKAVDALFESLDWLEDLLKQQRFLTGDQTTEADWRLFPTLYRFDTAYHGHFKCNRKRLVDYPNLWAYTRDLYQQPGIADTTCLRHVRKHYYGSHPEVNPTGVIAVGPKLDFNAPPDRAAR